MARARWQYLDPKDEARLRSMMESLQGKAGMTARWILEDEARWGRLCDIAERYAHTEPESENWKDAEHQWRAVHDAADALNRALEALGELASAVPGFPRLQSIGQWEAVRGNLHPVPGAAFAPPVHDLEWFAKVAVEECQRMKAEFNGAQRENEGGGLAFLIHQLFDLMEIPERPQAHAQQVAAVVHAWATKEMDALKNPRFGERAIKRVRAFRRGTQTPA